MVSQFLVGTRPGNAPQTYVLEQFTLQGNGNLAEIARTNRVIGGRVGGGRGRLTRR